MGRKTKYQEQMKMEEQKALENISAFYTDEISRINNLAEKINKALQKTSWITLFNKSTYIHYWYIGIVLIGFILGGITDNWKFALPGMIWIPLRLIVGLYIHILTGHYWRKRTKLFNSIQKKFQALTGMAPDDKYINDLFYL